MFLKEIGAECVCLRVPDAPSIPSEFRHLPQQIFKIHFHIELVHIENYRRRLSMNS